MFSRSVVGLILGFCCLAANAALHSRLSGQAYYDDVLNITWLADANYAQTSGYDADGRMNWAAAQTWITSLNTASHLGVSDWRLPTVTDTGTPGCVAIAYNGTDCGYNVDLSTGEMAHMFYGTLGNTGYYNTSGAPTGCSGSPPYCLTNDGPFANLRTDQAYWTGTASPNPIYAWRFYFGLGHQDYGDKGVGYFAWAVRSGDIAGTFCPAGVSSPDADGDGVPDLCDNCTATSNSDQSDSDYDGYGNRCDGDLNNNGVTNAQDFAMFRTRLGKTTTPPRYDVADMNSNATVNAQDYAIFRSLLGAAPGPSGRRETPTVFQATPINGYSKRVPVVLINFIPTQDGTLINNNLWQGRPYGLPAEWGQTLLISDVRTYASEINSRVKFALEEGSRFRGYKTPIAQAYLGYQIVAIYNFYDEMKPGQGYPGVPDAFLPDLKDIMARIPAQQLVETQGVKEFWVNVYEMWGAGQIIFPESNMSSPLTGDISNSHRIQDDLPVFSKSYVVYGTNYFRGEAEAIHNHGHQLEAMLSHAASMQDGNYNLFWSDFAGFDTSNPNAWVFVPGRCGAVHWPINARQDYDYYSNPNFVQSDCEDWRPDGTGQQTTVGLSTWVDLPYAWPTPTVTDVNQSQWLIYWMQNMPGAGNQIPYSATTMENWWEFTGDWDAAITAGKGLHR